MLRILPWLFAATLLLSAGLLFSVQPIAAKTLLPFVGGSPSAWITCMLFFQGLLILGYGYAHGMGQWKSGWASGAAHLSVLVLAAALLPLQLRSASTSPAGEFGPVPWLLVQLAALVGLPFFALSATAPLLQTWFSRTRHARAADPYFLYAASNAGSLLGLIGFIAFLEPNVGLHDQGVAWNWGFWLLAGLTLVSFLAAQLLRTSRGDAETAPATVPDTTPVGWRRRGFWIFAAFVPSSLLLGVTLHLSSDVGAFPLVWVVPLALYLLSHVLVFARRQVIPTSWAARAFPPAIIAVALVLCTGHSDPPGVVAAVHLGVFFCAAMMCHGRLAENRPPAAQLTEFYFCMALGGLAGGAFNALLAPLLFETIAEYPLALVLACTLLPPRVVYVPMTRGRRHSEPVPVVRSGSRKEQWTHPAGPEPRRARRHARHDADHFAEAHAEPVPAAARPIPWGPVAAVAGIGVFTFVAGSFVTEAGIESLQLQASVALALPLVACWALAERPGWFALGLGTLFLGSISYPNALGRTLHVERSFFGVSRVTLNSAGDSHQLAHGNTIHGRQFIDPAKAREPIAYYHRAGPAGDIFRWLAAHHDNADVAVVGLGAGSLLAYAQRGETWTVYEIDPAVAKIAADRRYFSHVDLHAADSLEVVLGDGRLRLAEARAQRFDLIVLDAFNSDAIPIHLLTHEAIELYLSKLAPGGLLAFHISSRYFSLEPILGAAAESLRLIGLARADLDLNPVALSTGRQASHWVILARRETGVAPLVDTRQWRPLEKRRHLRGWTDDRSSPLQALP